MNGARQSVSTVQLVRQAFVPQTYGVQLDAVGAAQPPVPLQCESGVNVDPEHDCVPHDTVVAASWQPPAPLQKPVLPQGGLAGHWPVAAGVPSGTLAQLPWLPATLHAWQSGQELAPQQTPSTQESPVRHSAVDVQDWPRRRRLPHLLVCGSQMLGGRQSPSPVQTEKQAVVPLHTYGAQGRDVAG